MAFARLLQKARLKAEVSLRDLAAEVGLSPVFLSDVERAHRRPPKAAVVMKIADKLRVADKRGFLMAALEERDRVELPVSKKESTRAKKDAALALARSWDNMSDEVARSITKVLEQ